MDNNVNSGWNNQNVESDITVISVFFQIFIYALFAYSVYIGFKYTIIYLGEIYRSILSFIN